SDVALLIFHAMDGDQGRPERKPQGPVPARGQRGARRRRRGGEHPAHQAEIAEEHRRFSRKAPDGNGLLAPAREKGLGAHSSTTPAAFSIRYPVLTSVSLKPGKNRLR